MLILTNKKNVNNIRINVLVVIMIMCVHDNISCTVSAAYKTLYYLVKSLWFGAHSIAPVFDLSMIVQYFCYYLPDMKCEKITL